jgi:hypothetical protein
MITVRAATGTDADEIAHVGVAAWREANRDLISDDGLSPCPLPTACGAKPRTHTGNERKLSSQTTTA